MNGNEVSGGGGGYISVHSINKSKHAMKKAFESEGHNNGEWLNLCKYCNKEILHKRRHEDGYTIIGFTGTRFCRCGEKMEVEDDCYCCLCSMGVT